MKKSLGQHFLTNPEIAARIAQAIPESCVVDNLIEVGPGGGILTQHLLHTGKTVHSVELDHSLIPELQRRFASASNLELVQGNFLKMDLTELSSSPFVIIGNFPYNISSQIIFKMLDYREDCPMMIGMFQKELADRLLAPPGSKTYGVISVLLQFYYEGERLFNLSPGAFFPPPKVKSTVIRLTRKAEHPDVDYKAFRKIVKQAFLSRRKKMRNTIGSYFDEAFRDSEPLFQQRPEQLSVEDFVYLTNHITQ